MGAMQNNEQTGGKKRGARGSVNNSSRLEAFTRRDPAGGADWAGCKPDRLQAVVAAITALGGAVTFGLSRDHGAHSLTLLLDDSRQTLWFNGSADLDAELAKVVETLEALD